MIKRLYYAAGLFAAGLLAGCGESLEDTYSDYAGDGMIRYVGKCSDVEINPGWERLQVVWKNNIDAGIKQVKITYQSEEDKEPVVRYEEPYNPENGNVTDTVYLENLSDAIYTVRVSNVAKDGSESLVEEKYGRPYSESHEDLRSFSRGVTAFAKMGDKLAVVLDQDNENIQEMQLVFKDTQGEEHIWNMKEHMTDSVSIAYQKMRDYIFLLPDEEGVDMDFNTLKVKRTGRLQGCIDVIRFDDEPLDVNERLWSTPFSQLMLAKYGTDWESKMDALETVEFDYDIPEMQDLMYLPNLKKVVLGKNRYMVRSFASNSNSQSTTDVYVGLSVLQFLQSTRDGFTVERYNNHYFTDANVRNYKNAGKLTDLTLVSKGNPSVQPNYVPLDTTGWKLTCTNSGDYADTIHSGYAKNGAAMLLFDGLRTSVNPEFEEFVKQWMSFGFSREEAESIAYDYGIDPVIEEEVYLQPNQTVGASVITVTIDMQRSQLVQGFKVGQYSRNEDNDMEYLLSSLLIEFSEDNVIWSQATYTDGNATIGNTPGEETFIEVHKDLQKPARYIRLTMSNRYVDKVSGSGLYNLRLAKFIPCSVQQ